MFKKIFILCFSGNQGGMELDAVRTCRRVSEYADVTLICMSGSTIERMAYEDIGSGYKYRVISSGLTRFLARALFDPRIALTVRREVRAQQPDLLVFFGTSEVKSIALGLLGLGTKLVLRIGTTIGRKKDSFFQRMAYHRVDGFLVNSEHLKQNIYWAFPCAVERPVEVCLPVIKVQPVPPGHIKETTTINAVYHSRFVRGKGQKDAVVAWTQVKAKYPNLRLTLVGSFEDAIYLDEIRQCAEQELLLGNLRLLESVSDVAPLLHQSQIFISPSYGEGFSNSFAEALAAGLVCVTYDNTSFPFVKQLGFDFFQAITGDTTDLAKALSLAVESVLNQSVNTSGNVMLAQKLFSASAERCALLRLAQSLG